jgi:hypothetical protein
MKIFGYIVKILIKLNKVMASLKDVVNKNTNKNIDLTEEEIVFLLSTLKNSKFKGSQVEILYNVAIKLQNLYNNLSKK